MVWCLFLCRWSSWLWSWRLCNLWGGLSAMPHWSVYHYLDGCVHNKHCSWRNEMHHFQHKKHPSYKVLKTSDLTFCLTLTEANFFIKPGSKVLAFKKWFICTIFHSYVINRIKPNLSNFDTQMSRASKLSTWSKLDTENLLYTILYMPSVIWLIVYTF